MNVDGTVAVVTGGGGGIGGALAQTLAREGARVVVADLDAARAQAVADSIGTGSAIAAGCDVADEASLEQVLGRAEEAFGPVDIFCANAGIGDGAGLGGEDEWAAALAVNTMAHVRAARLLLPGWLERGRGYFVSTASAAGLLTQIGSATYSVSKHAAVAFAEWLSVTYGDRGIAVSCLCPMGVNTDLLNAGLDTHGEEGVGARVVAAAGTVLEPEEVAARVLEAMAEERFLVLPHPEVLEFYRRKGQDYDRWLRGMRRLQDTVTRGAEPPR
jgi:NAD(P)-dependent dehydrogenase (short-subunit alcohol dehydrogenase family)